MFIDLITDNIKNKGYYQVIRYYVKDTNVSLDEIGKQMGTYYYHYCIDDFGPFKFIKAIEDYITQVYNCGTYLYSDIVDLIENAFDSGHMKMY